MQNLEQFQIIHASENLIETMQREQSNLGPEKTRHHWRQRIARVLVKIAQKLEPDLRTPIRSRRAKQ
jgi:hypothetical protein